MPDLEAIKRRAAELNALGRGAVGLWTRVNRQRCALDQEHHRYLTTTNNGAVRLDLDLGPCQHFPESQYPYPHETGRAS